ncbi:aspartyl-phosphate phosphatase Spo0E family protein [Virgibacillus alimentarius]|nr:MULTISPECIES: aspartyl-phosphate phosphatase Spo0E family protein [Virgibacillus]HLR67691.1 aspartyl-phosphate phosphatase Spo0E family protein [Virgibacillus sp.]
MTALRKKIEETRKMMYETYEKNPNDPEILFISQKLDVLLNKYDRLRKNTKKFK